MAREQVPGRSARDLGLVIVVIVLAVMTLVLGLMNVYLISSPRVQTVTRTVTEPPVVHTITSTMTKTVPTTVFATVTESVYHTVSETVTLTETVTRTVKATVAPSLKEETLVDREVINQPASACTVWTLRLPYPGYLEVVVHSSTSTNTYVRVRYEAYAVKFDQEIKVGASGTASFPILPSDSVKVYVCNSNLLSGATHTISITYHYW